MIIIYTRGRDRSFYLGCAEPVAFYGFGPRKISRVNNAWPTVNTPGGDFVNATAKAFVGPATRVTTEYDVIKRDFNVHLYTGL